MVVLVLCMKTRVSSLFGLMLTGKCVNEMMSWKWFDVEERRRYSWVVHLLQNSGVYLLDRRSLWIWRLDFDEEMARWVNEQRLRFYLCLRFYLFYLCNESLDLYIFLILGLCKRLCKNCFYVGSNCVQLEELFGQWFNEMEMNRKSHPYYEGPIRIMTSWI